MAQIKIYGRAEVLPGRRDRLSDVLHGCVMLGIAPMDVEMTLTETRRHDWAMRGLPGDELALNYRVDV